MLNPLIRRQWAEALRSNRFTQIQGAECIAPQHGSPCYCAFGVLVRLCEIATGKALFCQMPGALNQQSQIFLDWPVLEGWSGMRNARSLEGPDGLLIKAVVEANDAGVPFREIADTLIEPGRLEPAADAVGVLVRR